VLLHALETVLLLQEGVLPLQVQLAVKVTALALQNALQAGLVLAVLVKA
jgi:hypothetical protein